MTSVAQDVKPGAVLAAERESRDWSIEYICDQINLHKSVINALEKDEYDTLPPPAFVRGYIRSYAKLLEIESDPLVEKYEEIEAPAADVVPLVEPVTSATSDPFIRLLSGIVVAVVIGVLAFWWYSNGFLEESEIAIIPETSDSSPAEDEQPIETSQQVQTESEIIKPAEPLVAAGSELTEGVSYNRPSDLDDTNPSALPIVEVPVSAVLQNNPVIQNLSDETVELDNTPDTIEEAVILTQNSSAGSTPTDAATAFEQDLSIQNVPDSTGAELGDIAPTYPVEVTDTLLIKTDSESWVSIIDAAENRLMYGILTSGTPRKLQGVAPFNVVLGAAPGIEATLNGSAIDFSSLIRKSNTARFVIEKTGETHR